MNILDEAGKINFTKPQLSGMYLFNILYEEMGQTHKTFWLHTDI